MRSIPIEPPLAQREVPPFRGRSGAAHRVVLVTGGTDGIGRAVALKLARGGDRVLFVGRSVPRAAQVLGALRAAQPALDPVFLRADLSLLAQTARVAEDIARHTDRLDAVVFCAGMRSTIPQWTSEGLERNFVVNYLSRYLLAHRLLPFLKLAPSGRIVLVANTGAHGDSLDFDDLQHVHGEHGWGVSARTDVANDLFATELAERLRGTRIEATCVFPGITDTAVFRNARGLPWAVRVLAPALWHGVAQSPEAAAATPVFLAQDDQAEGTNGRFYGPGMKQRPVPECVQRPDRRARLWAASRELAGTYLSSRVTAANEAAGIPSYRQARTGT